jgi:hypothetical protein
MDALCIGGVFDGQFRKAREKFIKAIKPFPLEAVKPIGEVVQDRVEMHYEVYEPKQWRGEERVHNFYILVGLSKDDAMEMLTRNYRRAN